MSDISGELNQSSLEFMNSVNPEISPATSVNSPARISAQELHKYVIGLIGVLLMCAVTYPIAIVRVSQDKKLIPYQSHVKSLTLEYKSIDRDNSTR